MRLYKQQPFARRIRHGFLFLPREIGRETRWWENATWEEVYKPNYPTGQWEPVCWVDTDQPTP